MTAEPVGHWPLDDKGAVARDVSGNCNHGVYITITTPTDVTQRRVARRIVRALRRYNASGGAA